MECKYSMATLLHCRYIVRIAKRKDTIKLRAREFTLDTRCLEGSITANVVRDFILE